MAVILLFLKNLSWQTYLVGALVLSGVGLYVYVGHLRSEVASVTKERDGLEASIKAAQKLAVDTAAAELVAQKEIVDETQRLASRAHSDAVVAVGSHDRLLQRATAVASIGQAASAPEGSAPAQGPGLVLAGVLGRIDSTAGELAEYADQARIAGQACERAYDSLVAR